MITVATDGSAINNPKGPGGWSWYIDDSNWNAGSMAVASNQVMEISGILRALVDIPQGLDLKILTDSAFCVNMIGRNGSGGWMDGWKSKGWKKADGSAPANLLLVQKLDQVLQMRQGRLEFEWVKGHANNRLNQMADRKCRDASASQNRGVKFTGGPGWTRSASQPSFSVANPKTKEVKSEQGDLFSGGLFKNRERDAKKVPPVKVEPKKQEVKMRNDKVISFEQYCDSCNRPINMMTGECRCSI